MHHARNAVEKLADPISTTNSIQLWWSTRNSFSCTVSPKTRQTLITAQHTVHQITQRPPVILSARQFVLIDK